MNNRVMIPVLKVLTISPDCFFSPKRLSMEMKAIVIVDIVSRSMYDG